MTVESEQRVRRFAKGHLWMGALMLMCCLPACTRQPPAFGTATAQARKTVLTRYSHLTDAERMTIETQEPRTRYYHMSGTFGDYELMWHLSDGDWITVSFVGDFEEGVPSPREHVHITRRSQVKPVP